MMAWADVIVLYWLAFGLGFMAGGLFFYDAGTRPSRSPQRKATFMVQADRIRRH